MLELHEKIDVLRTPYEAWAYVADFRTAAEWDATAFESVKLDSGPLAVGTRFRVRCALPVGSITLMYTLTQLVPGKTVRLHGTCRCEQSFPDIAVQQPTTRTTFMLFAVSTLAHVPSSLQGERESSHVARSKMSPSRTHLRWASDHTHSATTSSSSSASGVLF